MKSEIFTFPDLIPAWLVNTTSLKSSFLSSLSLQVTSGKRIFQSFLSLGMSFPLNVVISVLSKSKEATFALGRQSEVVITYTSPLLLLSHLNQADSFINSNRTAAAVPV